MSRLRLACLAAFSIFLAASCLTDPAELTPAGDVGVSVSFAASFSDAPGSRTVLAEGNKVFWSPFDSIRVFRGSASAKFLSSAPETSASAVFSGTINIGDSQDPWIAVYPFDEADYSDGSRVTTTVPTVQHAIAGSFAPGMSPAVARAEGGELENIPLSFHNVCSGLKFSLAHSDITAITFRGNTGEKVAGKVRILFEEGSLPKVAQILDGGTQVRLTMADGGEFPTGEWFYLTILPQTFSQGFTLGFETPTMTADYAWESETTFRRSVWKRTETPDGALQFSFPGLASVPVQFRTSGIHNVSYTQLANDEYVLSLSGADPYVHTVTFQQDLDDAIHVLEFEYKAESPTDVLQVFFARQGSVTEASSQKFGSLPATDVYKVFRADVGAFRDGGWGLKGDGMRFDPGQNGSGKMHIRNFVLREMTADEKIHGVEADEDRSKREMAERLGTYLATSYPSKVSKVTVSADKVKVQGLCGALGDYLLVEITPWQDITEMSEFPYATPLSGGGFSIILDRSVPGREGITYDRVFSKWAVVKLENGRPILDSHARYADEVEAKRTPPTVPLRHKKGLAAGSGSAYYNDLDALDAASITMNVELSKLISGDGGSGFDYGGYSFTIGNSTGGGRQTLDKITKQASARGIVLSAILLAPSESVYKDPENTGGYYTMPDMTSALAFNRYAAVLEFLASRYSESNSTHGRINHWIMHNEVDQALIWTNMGNQPMLRYLDRYVKSMRICYNIVRQYDQEASVLGSFTHSWTSEGGGYAPKAMMERMVDYSEAEGDFLWGVAYHPYPQNLARPDFWSRDNEATDSDDAHFVTFRNPQVIDRWIRSSRNLYKGTTKRILFFSENGTSSPSYSESDLALQAAGACLAWKNINALAGVDGVQWHSWMDNPTEASQGLRLGLRAYGGQGLTDGEAKPVWYVWQAAGTDNEDNVFAPYLSVIGLTSWP